MGEKMLLSEMTTSNDVKLLLYGPSSTGKTCTACSFPLPIKYFDFDNKVSSAVQYYKTSDPERLKQIDVVQFAPMNQVDRMKAFTAELHKIQSLQHAKKPLPFKTLVLDSLTTFTSYLLDDYIHVSQKGMKRPEGGVNCMQDYQLLQKHMTQILTGLLSLDCNVIFIAHSQLEKDETTGSITNAVLMPGQLAAKLPIYFEEVYFTKVGPDGKYLLQTQGDSRTVCRTQRKLPKEIPAKYESIVGV
jgi:hypothetical protein